MTKFDNKKQTNPYTVKIDYTVNNCAHTETVTVDNPSDLAKFYKMRMSYIYSGVLDEELLWIANNERRQVTCIEITPELSFEDLLIIDEINH